MLGSSFALPILFALIATGLAVLRWRGRRVVESWHLLRDLSPVSSQWLSDYRRSGWSRPLEPDSAGHVV